MIKVSIFGALKKQAIQKNRCLYLQIRCSCNKNYCNKSRFYPLNKRQNNLLTSCAAKNGDDGYLLGNQTIKIDLTKLSLTKKFAQSFKVGPSRFLEFSLAVLKFIGGAFLAGFIGHISHDYLREIADSVFDLTLVKRTEVTAFETSYFGFLSVTYAIIIGNTFAVLYDQQTRIIQDLYDEVLALEILIQEIFLSIDDIGDRYNLFRKIKAYLDEELFEKTNVDSPFSTNAPLVNILNLLTSLRQKDVEVKSMVAAVEEVARCQSKRLAESAQILPQIHWVMLYGLAFLFISTFLIFETGINNPKEVKYIFTILCGICTSVLLVLQDLADPLGGMYTFLDHLQNRLTFVSQQLDDLLGQAPVAITTGQLNGQIANNVNEDKDVQKDHQITMDGNSTNDSSINGKLSS
eukprot:TRINITY_DN18615_c0_g1_i2.p1 TRINITY_DN18615_c0_g1~~TRINITY_DN18615_c0_g1_i2.p1  ORF type:complete len:406 (-),score=35.47 TRINITY_DN18615_c0_g1_i2:122-1339(-)